ncbi:MAG: DNA mismatch repair endonuclease MutL [Erysipelotrichaceae bacterium]|nr:DNA mismatch repair endonuclease MutL [Erysipelotrichaceae bacterium]
MSKIKVMDELLANKIAAGEVVEKCVSIVKELVENSIDAGATEIKIELKEAGIREIKVIDNGIGMDSNDALLAFQRHATSKLYNVDDLFNISSLGFRGEALPSIASVSEVILKTCQNDIGSLIHIKGGHVLENTLCESRIGTSITVSNLFYNTPARLKHLSSIYSELANISDYINKMALSYPKVKFLLTNDEKELLNTDGSGNLLKVIKAIYGLDVTKKMLSVSSENEDYHVSGYISMPEVNRASRNYMTTIVNGRVIKNASLNKSINEAYSSFKEDTRYPIVVLIIETDPSLIDVNIHPSKLDIKFSNFEELKQLINEMIIQTIRGKSLIPKIEKKESKPTIKYENLSLDLERNIVSEGENTDEVEYQARLSNLVNFKESSNLWEELEKKNNQENKQPSQEETTSCIEEISSEQDKLPELYPIGLALGTYIVCENEKGIYLIDQHAAQERINYEKYSYLLSHPSKNTIDTIVPIIIELPMNEFLIIKKNLEILENLNIHVEEFGSSSFRITTHPTWFSKNNPDKIIQGIFEQIVKEEKNFDLAKFNDHLAATIACKASVKANTRITKEDMESIINQLRRCNNPFNCPHGRPTIIEFTIYELEKMFKRSI